MVNFDPPGSVGLAVSDTRRLWISTLHQRSPQSIVSSLVEISGGTRLYAVCGVEGAAHEHATLVEVPDLSGHPAAVMEMIAPELQEAVGIMLFASPSCVSKTLFVTQ